MGADWRKEWQIRVKKLSLSCETGWEYVPESQEPGSVLTDIFLDMELENQRRFGKIWEKQEREFLSVIPEAEDVPRRLETALSVKASGESDGRWLAAGTRAYTVTDRGTLLGFCTVSSLRLTAARLRWIIRRRGLFAWLCHREEDGFPVNFSASPDRLLEHPVFRWRFRGLCDGHRSFCFRVEFGESGIPEAALSGSWTLGDGRNLYPGVWQQSPAGASLSGECPEFAGNLEGELYELRLEFSLEETLPEEWLRVLAGGIALREDASDQGPELCLTETGPGAADRVLPFGDAPEAAACFYIACDRAAGGASGDLILQFTEGYETEEKGPDPEPEEYRKLYRKYPWLRRTEQLQEWRVEETLWEYFDGRLWRALPGSVGWNTGCGTGEPGERRHRFCIPRDMSPCSVEGEEHIYLRLRVLKAGGAYAPYYRKRIPVLQSIGFRTTDRVFKPEDRKSPDIRRAEEEKVYFGFDREIRPDNCWYTGTGCLRFSPDQIKGPGERFGKRACWVEIPAGEEELTAFYPNYAAVRQNEEAEQGEPGKAEPGQFPERTVFYVETGDMGVLDAVSVADARYDRAGAPVQDELAAAEHFFSHYGRMLTIGDLALLLKERYPILNAEECTFYSERSRLMVKLVLNPRGEEQKEEGDSEEIRLEEVEGWLTGAIRRLGPLWLQRAEVKCELDCGNGSGGGGGEGIENIEAG